MSRYKYRVYWWKILEYFKKIFTGIKGKRKVNTMQVHCIIVDAQGGKSLGKTSISVHMELSTLPLRKANFKTLCQILDLPLDNMCSDEFPFSFE